VSRLSLFGKTKRLVASSYSKVTAMLIFCEFRGFPWTQEGGLQRAEPPGGAKERRRFLHITARNVWSTKVVNLIALTLSEQRNLNGA
jgi:hypothetical protein